MQVTSTSERNGNTFSQHSPWLMIDQSSSLSTVDQQLLKHQNPKMQTRQFYLLFKNKLRDLNDNRVSWEGNMMMITWESTY